MARYVIETQRLRLREFTPADLDAFYAMYTDPDVVRFWPKPPTRNDVERQLSHVMQSYESRGYSGWAVELRETGAFIGRIGLLQQFVNGSDEVEVGYVLARPYWGQGYATEAARACRDWAFENLHVARVISLIRPENARSIAVALRNGMQRVGSTLHVTLEHDIYAIDRAAWERLRDLPKAVSEGR